MSRPTRPTTGYRPLQMSSQSPSARAGIPTIATTARVTLRTRITRPRCRLPDSPLHITSSPRSRHARGSTSRPRRPSSRCREAARISFPASSTTAVTSPRRRPRRCRTRTLRSPTHRTLICTAAAAQEDEAATSTSGTWELHRSDASRPAPVRSARAGIPPRRSARRRTSSSPSAQELGTCSTREAPPAHF
jgi:hypothetical protein